jgi:hypothetical protein
MTLAAGLTLALLSTAALSYGFYLQARGVRPGPHADVAPSGRVAGLIVP